MVYIGPDAVVWNQKQRGKPDKCGYFPAVCVKISIKMDCHVFFVML